MPRLGYIREVPTVLGWRYHHGSITPRRTYVAKFIWQACIGCGKERWVRLVYRKPVSTACRKCVYKQNTYTRSLTWGDAIEYLSSSPEEQQRALQEHYEGIKQADKQRRIDERKLKRELKLASKQAKKHVSKRVDKQVDKRFGKRTGVSKLKGRIRPIKIDAGIGPIIKAHRQRTAEIKLAWINWAHTSNTPQFTCLKNNEKLILKSGALMLSKSPSKSIAKSQGWFSRLFSRLYGLCKR